MLCIPLHHDATKKLSLYLRKGVLRELYLRTLRALRNHNRILKCVATIYCQTKQYVMYFIVKYLKATSRKRIFNLNSLIRKLIESFYLIAKNKYLV